jgi:hypothetical protein
MDLVYAASDIVISRAGASSVSELSIVGKPVILSAQCCGGSSNEERKIDSRQERGSATEGIRWILNFSLVLKRY